MKKIIFTVMITSLLLSCSKSKTNNSVDATKHVYVAGYEAIGTSVAKYWKDGTGINLTNGTNQAEAFDILVSGTDVYVCGYENSAANGKEAKYWKNGVATTLGKGQANAMAINGADLYVAVTDYIGGKNVPLIYKNGVATSYSNIISASYSNNINGSNIIDIAFSNGSIYGCGTVLDAAFKSHAFFIKDATVTDLSSGGTQAYANGIAFYGADMYVAGYTRVSALGTGILTPCYWLNGGNSIQLTYVKGGVTHAIAANSSGVYCAGIMFDNTDKGAATLWKNNVVNVLSKGIAPDFAPSPEANGIFLDNNDVYVCGGDWVGTGTNKNMVAHYWKNGNPVQLSTANNNSTSVARAITVH